jgi:hypothetical protein
MAEAISDAQHRNLMQRCMWHVVAFCDACRAFYLPGELAHDLVTRRRSRFCPRCRADLSRALAEHLHACESFRGQVA